ncbi:MAG: hypothetical protein H6988_13535 [Pseudomonadales bacterium]|nr:hypothetical protein [Pseudomonadales bacterium]
MPIKCAGAPQVALYLSADYWRSSSVLPPIYWMAMLKGKEWMVDPEQARNRATPS